MNWADAKDTLETIGKNVRRCRVKLGLTQEALAARTNLTLGRTSITNIEAGRQKMTVLTALMLARALEVEIGELFQNTGDLSLVEITIGGETRFVSSDVVDRLMGELEGI